MGQLEQLKLGKAYSLRRSQGEREKGRERKDRDGARELTEHRSGDTDISSSSTLLYFPLTCSHSRILFQHSLVGSTR